MKKYLLLVLVLIFSFYGFSNVKVLFDNTHAQQAGSANWTINTGFSRFADDLTALDYTVNSLEHGPIKGETLSDYNVFIIPEPNTPFKASEITAIKSFVKNGGGLFLISDHNGADRNNNGWDAVKIFNVFVSEFGFDFETHSFSEHPINSNRYECSIMDGVNEVGSWMGTSIKIFDTSKVLGMMSFSSSHSGNPYIVVSTYGKGRVAAVGDSSPFDDGTASKGGLHNNYKDFDDRQMAINLSKWCAKKLGNELPIVDGSISNDNGNDQNSDDTTSDNNTPADNNGLVNINTATAAELDALPGIGKATARLIIEYRDQHGPFHNINEILNIPRIDKSNFKLYSDKICI